ncbi:MAG: hypothetical protein M1150_03080 [Patescibacteria group bacterium]|nr:hypothetical protein [Patescibacteria group bacterium]
MLSTPHMLVGAVIVKIIPNPFLGLPLAILSHFILDSMPHWDWKPPTPPYTKISFFKTAADLLIGSLIVYSITLKDSNQAYILAGALAGILPDVLQGIIAFLNFSLKRNFVSSYSNWHGKIQKRLAFFPGLFLMTAVVLIGILIITR